jgi:hypothetical protein
MEQAYTTHRQELEESGWSIFAEREKPNQPVFHLLRIGRKSHKPRFIIQG